eukprot:gene913-3136_t
MGPGGVPCKLAGPLRARLERLGLKVAVLGILEQRGIEWSSPVDSVFPARDEEQRLQPGTTGSRYSCLTTTLSACDARARVGMHPGMWLRMGPAGKARVGSSCFAVDDRGDAV